jgi:hypothetical protein
MSDGHRYSKGSNGPHLMSNILRLSAAWRKREGRFLPFQVSPLPCVAALFGLGLLRPMEKEYTFFPE